MVKRIGGFCIDCGNPRSDTPSKRCQRCHLKKLNSGQKGVNHPNWRGEKYEHGPYYAVWSGTGKKEREHRIIAEKALGRKLRKNELVHHIDGNGRNNKNNNLLICDKSYHNWLHWKMADLYMKEHFTR